MSSKTILVYLDGTSSCESVLQYAVRLAAVDSGKVLLVCTEREFEHNIIQASPYPEQLITRLKAQPSRIDNPVEICPVAGSTNPMDHVLTAARRYAATDIIMSATLKAPLRRTLQ